MINYGVVLSGEAQYTRAVKQAVLDFEARHGEGIPAKSADLDELPKAGVFAITDDGELLGGLTYRVYNDWVFLDWGFVWSAWRRKGIYSALIRKLEDTAKSAGLVGLEVWTYEWEAPAVYEALGFTRGAVLRNFPRGNTSIEYQKEF